MRIDIPLGFTLKDKDIKAIVLIRYALEELSTPRMKKANLNFVLNRKEHKELVLQ